jgi:hypothetical protein
MVEYIMKKRNLRDISCKMRDAGFGESFRDCPAKGRTGSHPSEGPGNLVLQDTGCTCGRRRLFLRINIIIWFWVLDIVDMIRGRLPRQRIKIMKLTYTWSRAVLRKPVSRRTPVFLHKVSGVQRIFIRNCIFARKS